MVVSPTDRAVPWTYVLDEPLRILVVDDDPILREFASVYLATPSAAIETACDGNEARARLREGGYDLLLLDIEMPQLDGLSLLEEIRSDAMLSDLPVIMLTGHDDIASIDRAYQLGADSFATKPVNWRQLSYQIRYVIRTKRVEGSRTGSHNLPQDAACASTSQGAEADVRNFLQSIIYRAEALERQLPIKDRAQFSEQLLAIRLFAQRAYSEYSRDDCAASPAEVANRPDDAAAGLPSHKRRVG